MLVKDVFAFIGNGARDHLARRLSGEADIQPPEGPRRAFVIEARMAGAAEGAPATGLGRVTMTTRELRLETNSRERADRLRERLEGLADGRLRHKRRDESDAGEMMAEASRREASGKGRRSKPLRGTSRGRGGAVVQAGDPAPLGRRTAYAPYQGNGRTRPTKGTLG